MKQKILSVLSWMVRKIFNQAEMEFGATFFQNNAVGQKSLMQQYRLLALENPASLPKIDDVGFRVHSQFEEDGILLYIFSLVRPINRKCVEICAGSGRECMAANLIINHGWWGYLFDGNINNVVAGRKFFGKNKETFFHPPEYQHAWITAENVNGLIAGSGVTGPVDLLSLDVDGIDYWLWKAITVIQPTVVVCEIHNMIPADRALTVPYSPKFTFDSVEFRGASLAAMCKLGREKGYRLIGTHRYGFNAFFVKNGIGEEFFPEVDPASCLNDPVTTRLQKERWPEIEKKGWVEV